MFRFKLVLFIFVFEYGVFLQYVLTVLEKPWHPACVRCSDCLAKLNEKCFARDGKIYCRDDFYRYPIIVCPTAVPDDRIHGRFIERCL
jgi:hypothetical protein